jgi:Cu+-exporting ATPase
MIALIIKSCEMLDINLQIQYNESMKHGVGSDDLFDREGQQVVKEDGITMISISGMTCAACTGSVETALMKVRGVDQVLVSLPLQDARIFHESGIEPSKLITAVQDAGYGASIGERSAAQKLDVLRHTQELKTLRISLKGLVSLSTLIFCLGKGPEWLGFKSIGQRMILLNARSFILLGWTVMAATKYGMWIFRHAADAARQGCVNMHTLISLSTIVGLSLTLLNIYQHNEEAQYFDTIVGVLLIITIGRYMDLLSRRRATDTFEGLYTLLDETSSARLAKINVRSGSTL